MNVIDPVWKSKENYASWNNCIVSEGPRTMKNSVLQSTLFMLPNDTRSACCKKQNLSLIDARQSSYEFNLNKIGNMEKKIFFSAKPIDDLFTICLTHALLITGCFRCMWRNHSLSGDKKVRKMFNEFLGNVLNYFSYWRKVDVNQI